MDDHALDFDGPLSDALEDDMGGDAAEADTGLFYWALKGALERTPLEPPSLTLQGGLGS